jgi:2-keto-4-pentenoate hydratase/2-oxohepta-3-ene-1,7-dioic acid hydratase in catechol pathway
MHLRTTSEGTLIQWDDRWVALGRALEIAESDDPCLAAAASDALGFLRADDETRAKAAALVELVADQPGVQADPSMAGLPFAPRSMRAFMLRRSQAVGSGRMLIKYFFPVPVWAVDTRFERSRRIFPKLKLSMRFLKTPTFSMGNHTILLADGQEVGWPPHSNALDFELALACVLRAPIVDATPDEARVAVGGWFVLGHWSVRGEPAEVISHPTLGPVIKAKTLANSIGCDVVTADEFGGRNQVTGRVHVDGDMWCKGARPNPAHNIGEVLAYASKYERLDAGDVISTGTIPGCCALELERWIKPGDTAQLQIDGIGTLTNGVSAGAFATTGAPA